MKDGCVPLALARVNAVRDQANLEQPGTLLYLVHQVLDASGNATRSLLFYECYRNQAALDAHLASSSWQTLVNGWSECFEGTSTIGNGITLTSLDRLGGFVRLDVPEA